MLTLALTLSIAAAPPRHPWTAFPKGAWAQYVAGSTDYSRGALVYVGLTGTHVTVKGTGVLNGETGWDELGDDCPACDKRSTKGASRKVKVGDQEVSCDDWDFKTPRAVNRECRAAGRTWPLVIEHAPTDGVGYTLTLTAVDVPLFISGQKLFGARYEGTRTSGAQMTEVRCAEVPGGLVMQFVENRKTGNHDLRVLEAFGLKGAPVDTDVVKSAWHPWASHPVGAWVKTKGTSDVTRTALAAVTDSTLSFERSPKEPHALGQYQAARDPTSKFAGVAMVKVAGREYPCVVWTFTGKMGGAEFVRRDCQSVFARVPIYAEEQGGLAGVTYFDTWLAQTLEVPGTVGSHAVSTVTFVRKQKLSNDATSKDEVVLSPEVPGGVVRWTSRHELNGKEVSEVSQQVIDFGR